MAEEYGTVRKVCHNFIQRLPKDNKVANRQPGIVDDDDDLYEHFTQRLISVRAQICIVLDSAKILRLQQQLAAESR